MKCFLLDEPQQQKVDSKKEFTFITGIALEVQTADSKVFKANDRAILPLLNLAQKLILVSMQIYMNQEVCSRYIICLYLNPLA